MYQQGGGYDNQAKFSHELVAGGAAFEGFKLFEDHQRKEGKHQSFQTVMKSNRLTGIQASQYLTHSPRNFLLGMPMSVKPFEIKTDVVQVRWWRGRQAC